IFIAVNSQSKSLIAGPEIHARGVAESDDVFDTIVPKVTKAVEDALRDGTVDQYQLQQVVRPTNGRGVSAMLRRKPMSVRMCATLLAYSGQKFCAGRPLSDVESPAGGSIARSDRLSQWIHPQETSGA